MIYIVASYRLFDGSAKVAVCSNVKDLNETFSKISEGFIIRIENFDSNTYNETQIEFVSSLLKKQPRITRNIIDKLLNCKVIINETEFFLWNLPKQIEIFIKGKDDQYEEIKTDGHVMATILVANLFLDKDLEAKFAIQSSILTQNGGQKMNVNQFYALYIKV